MLNTRSGVVDRSIKPTTKPKPGATCTWHASSTQLLPISFKPLLKYLRRCALVNLGKILKGKRVGHAQNIGINGLQGQHLACLQVMNEAGIRHTSRYASIGETNDIRYLHGRALVDSQFDAGLQE